MILMSHPLGNANVRNAALALNDAGLLAELWTCLHWQPGHLLERLLPASLRRELSRRSFPATIRDRVHTSPWREMGRLLAGRLPGSDWLTRHETGWCSVDAVFAALDARVGRRVDSLRARGTPALSGVYGYEDAAAATFQVAGRGGLARFYDLPIGYWRAWQEIFAEEAERAPEWAATLTGREDSPAKLARKDEELQMADAVIVASSFTRQTLLTAPAFRAPVHVIPYGAPAPPAQPLENLEAAPAGRRKLRVLFAGALSQRKGLSYLLAAIQTLGSSFELTLLGGKTAKDCLPLDQAVRQHRWIPSLSHADVLAEMARQDVLVFPSLFEGFGLVILEAMSRGLPVIATPHTAGPDLITDSVDGFIIPIRSPAAIAEKLELLLRDPARLLAMKVAARKKAETLTWQNYRTRLAAAVTQTLARP